MLISLLCVATVLGDLPPPKMGACSGDDDCVITTESRCCDCCKGVPRAAARSEQAEQEDCSHKNCGFVPCRESKCAAAQDPSTLRAVCRAGTCRAEPVMVKKNPSICVRDSDCTVASFSCCEQCCPAPQRATTLDELQLMRGQCASTMCPMIRCAPDQCPAPPPQQTAECRDNRCRLVPAKRPLPPQCRQDTDCRVVYPAPPRRPGVCQCPMPTAVPSTHRLTRDERSEPAPKKQSFGLSQPDSRCPPCQTATPAEAECREGQCLIRQ